MNIGKIITFVLAVHACVAGLLFYSSCKSNGTDEQPATSTTAMGTTSRDDTRVAPLALNDGSSPSGMLPADTTPPQTFTTANTTSSTPFSAPETYIVKRGDSLDKIARQKGVSVRELIDLNNIKNPSLLREGQSLLVPASSGNTYAGASTASSSEPKALPGMTTYKVKSGDSLSVIAKRTGTTVAKLRAANNLKNDRINVGQTLIIPEGSSSGTSSSGTSSAVRSTSSSAPVVSGDVYVVKSGDTLGEIAKAHGTTSKNLMEWNGISDPTKLQIGQKIVVKPNGSGVSTQPSTAPANISTSTSGTQTPVLDANGLPPIETQEITLPNSETDTILLPSSGNPDILLPDSGLNSTQDGILLPPQEMDILPLNEITE